MDLFKAIEKNDLKLLKELLDSGEHDVEATQINDCTPLFYASGIGSVEAVKMLLQYGSNINRKTTSRNTPLMAASHFGNLKIVKLLCENGATESINAKNSRGETALTLATRQNHFNIVDFLFENGATFIFY